MIQHRHNQNVIAVRRADNQYAQAMRRSSCTIARQWSKDDSVRDCAARKACNHVRRYSKVVEAAMAIPA